MHQPVFLNHTHQYIFLAPAGPPRCHKHTDFTRPGGGRVPPAPVSGGLLKCSFRSCALHSTLNLFKFIFFFVCIYATLCQNNKWEQITGHPLDCCISPHRTVSFIITLSNLGAVCCPVLQGGAGPRAPRRGTRRRHPRRRPGAGGRCPPRSLLPPPAPGPINGRGEGRQAADQGQGKGNGALSCQDHRPVQSVRSPFFAG